MELNTCTRVAGIFPNIGAQPCCWTTWTTQPCLRITFDYGITVSPNLVPSANHDAGTSQLHHRQIQF